MCHQDLQCECNNHAAGHVSHERCNCHQQPEEMSNHRSRSSNNYYSSTSRGHSDNGPSLAGAARSVRFAEMSLLKVVSKHDEREDVDLQDLWYSQADLKLMRLAALREELMIRWTDV